MEKYFYDMIFKRKSFHNFKDIPDSKISDETIKDIENKFYSFTPLIKDIKVKIKFVKDNENYKKNQEYLIFMYSQKKDNYLQNIGYLGEQLDLYLASINIGALWFGLGKTKMKKEDGLDFVIMIAIKKVDSSLFRKTITDVPRLELSKIISGDYYKDNIKDIRYAPSAVNSQPWFLETSKDYIKVYRIRRDSKTGILPIRFVNYLNRIDIGILLCFLDVCLLKNNIEYTKELYIEENVNKKKNLTAVYSIK